MANHEIQYRFDLPDGSTRGLTMQLDPVTLEREDPLPNPLPSWTELDFHRCPNCPFAAGSRPNCPLAERLVDLVNLSSALRSYEEIRVTVTTADRTTRHTTSAQRAFSSLLGLVGPTSGCPKLAFFKPMARFHLPFASREETAYRVAAMYLLGQHLRSKQGKSVQPGLKGLDLIYEDIVEVNRAVAHRLRAATSRDAAVNALIILDVLAQVVPIAVSGDLEWLGEFFHAHLEDDSP